MTKTVDEPALLLPQDAVPGTGPQTFGVFPGLFTPGEPLPLAELGLTVSQARDEIRRLGLPLEVLGAGDELPDEKRARSRPTQAERTATTAAVVTPAETAAEGSDAVDR